MRKITVKQLKKLSKLITEKWKKLNKELDEAMTEGIMNPTEKVEEQILGLVLDSVFTEGIMFGLICLLKGNKLEKSLDIASGYDDFHKTVFGTINRQIELMRVLKNPPRAESNPFTD